MNLRRNSPPEYDHDRNYEANFDRFFDWALGLKDPGKQIPALGERLGFGCRVHPIGFIAVYLSEQCRGIRTINSTGLVRANIYPVGVELKEDIHSHGFDFRSGVVRGELINVRHYPDWGRRAPYGEGYVGYETSVDVYGQNRSVLATDPCVVIPRQERQELGQGTTYTMESRTDFHSVESEGHTVTLFAKTPTYEGHDGLSLVLKHPDSLRPPENY